MLAEMRHPTMKEYLAHTSRPEWGLDKSKKPEDVPQASFRKLNVD